MRLVTHPRRLRKWPQRIANLAVILFACALLSGLTLLGALRLQPEGGPVLVEPPLRSVSRGPEQPPGIWRLPAARGHLASAGG